MTYSCDRCSAPLPGGVSACPHCGRQFDSAVPNDAPEQGPEASVDALLRRTASGSQPAQGTAWYGSAPSTSNQTIGPVRRRPVWALAAAGVASVGLLLSLAGWGANTLWMRGKGGDIAFRQHNGAGNRASERGDFAKADDEYSQMIALRPHKVDGYLLRAINEIQEGKMTEAISDNTQALSLAQEPTMRGDLFYNRAEAYAKQGRYVKAIAGYTQADAEYTREHDPRMLPEIPERRRGVYSLRADAYWQHKDYALSIKDSKIAIGMGHAHPDDYGVQAKAEAALGQDAAAEADFKQALRLDPAYLDGYIGLGNLKEKQHQYPQAVAVFQQATSEAPTNAQFWGSLGWFQYKTGQNTQAIVSDRHAQALDPNQAWVNYNLALTYAAAGQSALARAAYADALAGGRESERTAGLADIRDALLKQPNSAALRSALAQVQQGSPSGPRPLRASLPPPPLPAPSKPPAPPARFAALLGPEVVLADGYGIQPPLGYTLTQQPEIGLSGTSIAYLWLGPHRADGTAPTLQVVVGRDDGSLAAHETQPQVAQQALNNQGDNHTGLRVSPVASVIINGLSFDAGEWDGTGQRTGKEYQGAEYWSVSPSHILHLSSHDALPDSRATLPLLKASLLTFRRR